MSSNATANYECVLNSLWMLNTSYKACLRSDVHSVMCLWISDWRVVLMILSHVRGKNLKFKRTHGERHGLSIFSINRKQYVHLPTTEANIHVLITMCFARQKINLSPFKMSLNSEVESLKCTWMSLKFVLTKPYEPCLEEALSCTTVANLPRCPTRRFDAGHGPGRQLRLEGARPGWPTDRDHRRKSGSSRSSRRLHRRLRLCHSTPQEQVQYQQVGVTILSVASSSSSLACHVIWGRRYAD